MALQGDVETQLDEVRQWDGAPLPTALRARLKREWQKVQGLTEQIGSLETERRAELRTMKRGRWRRSASWPRSAGWGQ